MKNLKKLEKHMKIVIAIDSFKGSLTSMEAGDACAKGIRRVMPDADIVVRPLADGGEGTVDALVTGLHGRYETVGVTGPLGEKVDCRYGTIDSESSVVKDCSKTAVIEMSGAAGITLVKREDLNPLKATTYGVGEVIKDAYAKGCRRFIIGIGGSATNDGGAGRLDAQTAMGKAPIGVAELAKKYGKPVIAFAGSVTDDAKILNSKGIDAFFPMVRGITTLDEAMDPYHAKQNMSDTAEQVIRAVEIFHQNLICHAVI